MIPLKLTDLIFRSWYYFRLGYGTYLSFFVGFFQLIVTTYYLAIPKIPFLQEVFGHLVFFVVFTMVAIIPLSVLIGWFHMKRTQAYQTDTVIGVESNPYNYKISPGKETEIFIPYYAVVCSLLLKTLERQNLLSAEEKNELEKIRSNLNTLMQGGVVGKPKAHMNS
jgi:hypothetical protein